MIFTISGLNEFQTIAIAGLPGTGKTTLANKLCERYQRRVMTTDSLYATYAMDERPRMLIDWWKANQLVTVVEGCEVARMLRYGARTSSWTPKAVVFISPRHRNVGPYAKGLQTIFADYMEIKHPHVQLWTITPEQLAT